MLKKLTSDNYEETLKSCNGILVPGGFGKRATNGKLLAIKYAREHNVPFFGICYGMQLAIIEYARNVLGYKDAETTEIDPNTKMPLIHTLEAPGTDLGGTLRLGLYDCKIVKETK